jgi:hypothetical protein
MVEKDPLRGRENDVHRKPSLGDPLRQIDDHALRATTANRGQEERDGRSGQ